MRILLDTHALLWWLEDSPRLSTRARELMARGGNELLWSAASSWELAIKASLGRIRTPAPVGRFVGRVVREEALSVLPIQQSHALRVAELPLHHRDPFDRLLVAQAQLERVPLLSVDEDLARYEVEVLW